MVSWGHHPTEQAGRLFSCGGMPRGGSHEFQYRSDLSGVSLPCKAHGKDGVRQARVERIDEKLVTRAPVAYHDGTKVESSLLIDCNGNVIAKVGHRMVEWRARKFLWWSFPAWNYWVLIDSSETVWEALRRTEVVVRYVVVLREYYHELTLYKPPKSFPNVLDWMEEQVRRSQEDLRARVREIDE